MKVRQMLKDNIIITLMSVMLVAIIVLFLREFLVFGKQNYALPLLPETPSETRLVEDVDSDQDEHPHTDKILLHEQQAGVPLSRIARLIIASEGVRSEPYLDSGGVVTIGIGRSLQTNGITSVELRAIVPDLDYDLLIDMASIHQGRVKIGSIELAKRIFTKPLTEHDMHLLLAADLKSVKMDAVRVFGSDWHKIDTVRQEAILDIIYNLGLPHFKGFVNFIDAVKVGAWKKAASELLLSEAARQNYSRYNHVSLVIDTGDAKYFTVD